MSTHPPTHTTASRTARRLRGLLSAIGIRGRRGRHHQPWASRFHPGARVLLECEPEVTPSVIGSVLEDSGYQVRICHGPVESCDLLENRACALLDGADVVVNMLHDRRTQRAVLEQTVQLRRPPAVVAEMSPRAVAEIESGLADTEVLDPARTTVLTSPVGRRALLEAVRTALAKGDRPSPIWGDAV